MLIDGIVCLFVGVPDSGGRQFVIFFMDNVVEAPRHLPLEVYITPLRTPKATVQIESPLWFEPSVWLKTEVFQCFFNFCLM